ncbi:site-2 protease family protein [Dactylosporangium sucinum]|uniref:Site-2 protease family protein n=1 Tax=Dactylosporangium sucinum TaxID=1424081 RepID=A0A917X4T4_9ACTN|nr:site-2 protease family protein [Dactylosporangium sucinum]GGM66261.1 site-2 protease family protein [Dactylosporangium sucinum]
MSYGRYTDRVARLPREAFRPSPIFLGLVALFLITGWMTWAGFGNVRINVFLFVAAGWTISLCLHEYSHAVVAYKGGDHDIAHRGYLTLDPLKYTHPLLSIVLPLVFVLLGGIGLPGGAVWVNHSAVRSRFVDSLISFAGPATNLVLAVVMVLPFGLGLADTGHPDFWAALAFLAFLQLTASVLNFVPMPGVDGGNLIFPWLSPQWQRGFNHVAPYGMLMLIALLWSPVINRWFFEVVYTIGDAIGLPSFLVGDGYDLFKFWSF